MSYSYGVGGTSPSMPYASSPAVPRAVTPLGVPMPGNQPGSVQPGSITYTQTVGPDGQVIYHPFK